MFTRLWIEDHLLSRDRDHVPPPEGHESVIVKALERQRLAPVSDANKGLNIHSSHS